MGQKQLPNAGTDWIPGDGIPWVCAQCWFILGPSTIPQSAALRKLHGHIASGHVKQQGTWSDEDPEDQVDEDALGDGEDQDGQEGHERHRGRQGGATDEGVQGRINELLREQSTDRATGAKP